MNKSFIDSDILIDLLAKRTYYEEALNLLSLITESNAKAYTTPLVLENINYIITKFGTKQKSRKALKTLRRNIAILTIDEKVFDEAQDSSFPDFEDALQYFSAMNQDIDFIITRNKKDYSKGNLKVVTAGEYLTIHSASQKSKGV